jgi:predicted molibdopterin-dependent oxidoreductase YjgC
MVEACGRGDLDVLFASGGNFLDVLPDPRLVRDALARVPLRVHQDIVVSSQMLIPPGAGAGTDGDGAGEVILLPAATRYEQEGGGTETTTERRIIFSPEIPGHQVGEARSEWRIFADLATRVRPDLAAGFAWKDNADLRGEIARVVPLYAGIESLRKSGDSVQYGGRHLALPYRRFRPVVPPQHHLADDEFFVSTRRGKQFNSMVFAEADPLNGARRDDVLIDEADARELRLAAGDPVTLVSETGRFEGHVRLARLPARALQVHWPEANVLLPSGPGHREPHSQVPDYNTVVRIERR